jgi:RNA polymerase sigma-70 factor, ECF subfamily
MDRDSSHRGAGLKPTPGREHDELAALLGRSRRRLVGHLARRLGLPHLAAAEDAVQAASLKALAHWPTEGLPANPAGWLFRVAEHHARDQWRRNAREVPWPEHDDELPLHTPAAPARLAGELDDEELALLFAACHPALPQASQVALALRTVAGLAVEDIARGLLVTPAALAQRLARARQVLAGVSLSLPAGQELPPRREAVLTALMLMFTHGQHSATPALCWEAVRLARAVAAQALVGHADCDALAALLCLHGARLSGRFDDAGDIVPLPGQARDRWDAGLIRFGLTHLQAAQRTQALSRWHLMAGIAAEHATAPSYERTDWAAIVDFYELLMKLDTSAAPRLGHAIALVESGRPGGAAQAERLLATLLPQVPEGLRPHTLAALSRALQQQGRRAEACRRLAEAAACARPGADQRWLLQRLHTLEALAAQERDGE